MTRNPETSQRRWPLFLIASPAAVAVWSGWVGLGTMSGFGIVHPLPGIAPGFELNTAITLPVGVEAYGAYALGAWLAPGAPKKARIFARRSAVGALCLGMAGQVIYHLLAAAHTSRAPWPVVVLVSCLPVITLGFGAALTHLLRAGDQAGEVSVDTLPKDDPASTPAVPANLSRPGSAGARFPEPGSVGTPVLTEPVLGTAHGSGTGEGSHADIPENRELEPTSVSGTVPSPGVRSNRSRRAPGSQSLHSTDRIERTARALADAYQAEHDRPIKVDDLQAGLTDAGMGRSRAEVARLRRQVLGLEKQQVSA